MINSTAFKQPAHELRVALAFSGADIDPDAITKATGIEPTKIQRIGEHQGRIQVIINRWELESGAKAEDGFDAHLESLLNKLLPYWTRLVQFSGLHKPILSCLVRQDSTSYSGPAVVFPAATVHKLAELNAAIDIDLYISSKSSTVKAT